MVDLTCNVCYFVADNPLQWGNHIVNHHAGNFSPVFPGSLPPFQYQLPPPQFIFSPPLEPQPESRERRSTPDSSVKVEKIEEAYPCQSSYFEEKENRSYLVQNVQQVPLL
jgi:hypothetical protein